MKKQMIVLVLSILGFSSAFAATQAGLALCPSAVDAFKTTQLYLGTTHVELSTGGSEPQFSSHIEWDQNGVVTLIRNNKADIILGQGVRPATSSLCGVFKFTVSDKINIEARSKKGLPYPYCSTDNGCQMVHPKNDQIIIHSNGENIIYIGRWG